jgi:hypothetical protein
MRQCNCCAREKCEIIGKNRFPQMREKHKLTAEQMASDCKQYIPLKPINQIGGSK